MVGRRPSGTLATNRPIAKFRVSPIGRPAPSVPRGMKATPIPIATIAISRATRFTCFSSGDSSARTDCDRAAIRPSSVRMPVVCTTATASPWVQVVPLKSRSEASSSELRPPSSRSLRVTGTDSPVRVERSICTLPDRMRQSAETRSPSAIMITSPRTSSRASIWRDTPSLTTRACSGRYADRASTARSACRSWRKAKAALMRTTRTMASARAGVPLSAAMTAASQSSSASGCTSWRASAAGQVRRVRRSSSLGPSSSSRRVASRSERPVRRLRRSRSNRSTDSRGSGPGGLSAPCGSWFRARVSTCAITVLRSRRRRRRPREARNLATSPGRVLRSSPAREGRHEGPGPMGPSGTIRGSSDRGAGAGPDLL